MEQQRLCSRKVCGSARHWLGLNKFCFVCIIYGWLLYINTISFFYIRKCTRTKKRKTKIWILGTVFVIVMILCFFKVFISIIKHPWKPLQAYVWTCKWLNVCIYVCLHLKPRREKKWKKQNVDSDIFLSWNYWIDFFHLLCVFWDADSSSFCISIWCLFMNLVFLEMIIHDA